MFVCPNDLLTGKTYFEKLQFIIVFFAFYHLGGRLYLYCDFVHSSKIPCIHTSFESLN